MANLIVHPIARGMDELIWTLCGATLRNKLLWSLREPKWHCANCGSREEWMAIIGEEITVSLTREMSFKKRKIGFCRKERYEFIAYRFSLWVTKHGYSENADPQKERELIENGIKRSPYFWMSHLHEEILHQQRHCAIEAADKRAEELKNFVAPPPPAFEPSDDGDEMFRKAEALVKDLIASSR